MMAERIQKEFVTTGQAAELCSVTPDAVLKWVKAGRIPASRTPGGHFRIHRSALLSIMESGELSVSAAEEKPGQPYKFCWDYYSVGGKVKKGCLKCIAFRSRALRCYEMRDLPKNAGFAGLFCNKACADCDYYRVVHGQRPNILVVTESRQIREAIQKSEKTIDFNLALANSEYRCSMLIETFRPDFVVIDSDSPSINCLDLARHIGEDPRIPFAKIIISGTKKKFPDECDKRIFAFIEGEFDPHDLTYLLKGLKAD